jgi:hypothetical protein
MKKAAVLIVILGLVVGCTTGIRDVMKDPLFQAGNKPVREVRLLVFSNTPEKTETILRFVRERSDATEEQVGIRLKVVEIQPIQFTGWTPRGILTDMHRAARGTEYAMSVAFTGRLLPTDSLMLVGLGTFVGVIDDTYRRYMVVRAMDRYVFLHEFFSCLHL